MRHLKTERNNYPELFILLMYVAEAEILFYIFKFKLF